MNRQAGRETRRTLSVTEVCTRSWEGQKMKEVVLSVLRENLWEGFTMLVTFFKKEPNLNIQAL